MTTFKDFDWSITNRELVLLVPNFGRGRYIRKVIDSLTATCIEKSQWIILIINDAIHEDFSDLADKNVAYFTVDRIDKYERGDAFMRNICIKYSQSKMIAQKDPEIFYTNDFIDGCFDNQGVLYRCGGSSYLAKEHDTNEYLSGNIDKDRLIKNADRYPITEKFVYWHFGHCAPIESFRNLNGYDEDFKYYGYVDTDMWDRLMKSGLKQRIDSACSPVHLWHPKPHFKTHERDIKRYEAMGRLYNSKINGSIVANNNTNWGEGDLDYKPEII